MKILKTKKILKNKKILKTKKVNPKILKVKKKMLSKEKTIHMRKF